MDQISAVRFGGLEGAAAGDASAVAAAAVGAEADSAALLVAAASLPAVVVASVSSPALGAPAVAAPASGAAASSAMVAGATSSGDAIGSSQYRVVSGSQIKRYLCTFADAGNEEKIRSKKDAVYFRDVMANAMDQNCTEN